MKIVFLCVANSARSQMAEGLARDMFGDKVIVASAGSEPGKLNPFAIESMKEINIDISHHHSKPIVEVLSADVDFVITLCADEVCPTVPGTIQKLHWPFEDPAAQKGSPQEILRKFSEVRDQIQARLMDFRIQLNKS